MMIKQFSLLLFCLFLSIPNLLNGQQLIRDGNNYLNVPELQALESTPLHFYAVSGQDGLLIFRSYNDSLSYLLTLDAFAGADRTFKADLRFGYLFGGEDNRITVIDPTSLLGVFSSTNLPELTRDVARIQNHLFMLTESGDLYQSDLTNSAVFDTSATLSPLFDGLAFTSLSGNEKKVWVLDSNHQIYTISLNSSNIPVSGTAFETLPSISNLKSAGNTLFGWNVDGDIYQISEDQTLKITSFPSAISDLVHHDNQTFVVTERHSIYTILDGNPVALRTTSEASHKLVSADNNLYLSSFNDIYNVRFDSTRKVTKPKLTAPDEAPQPETNQESIESWTLVKPDTKFTITYPRPFILHLETKPASVGPELTYNVQSNISGISFEENNLYYKPSASDIGTHPVKIIATDNSGNADSANIVLDIRAFNMPPRFTPIRKLSIGVGENFELQIRAIDPDGQNKNLVRYVGLDMPQGATINEKTGLFSWKPTARQVNTYQFRVIATDQFGTSASTDVTISVKDVQQVNN
jgi:hypothetical protein